MTNKQKLEKALQQITGFEQHLYDDYCFIGSAALLMAGVEIDSFADIDILTSSRDADRLKTLWNDKLDSNHRFKDNSFFRSNFARFDFEDISIEVMGDLEIFINSQWEKLEINQCQDVKIGNQFFKIPTLEEQKRILLTFGRTKDIKRVEMIDKFINSTYRFYL
jgi:hypothetical protein